MAEPDHPAERGAADVRITEAPAARRLADRLRWQTIAAALTPMSGGAEVGLAALPDYLGHLERAGVGGFAVLAHTGRGPYLAATDATAVLRTARAATSLPIIAGVGVRPGADPARGLSAAYVAAAERAAAAGADAVMIFPPAMLGVEPDPDAAVLALHERLAAAVDLPQLIFVLTPESGGYVYSADLFAHLLALPTTIGAKLATLDDAITCQDYLDLARRDHPDRLMITGEDRMLGPSLMWGAQAALVGIAAAVPELTVDTVTAWQRGDHARFVAAARRLDELAALTFRQPMDGYIARMACLARVSGILAPEWSQDPMGAPLPADEERRLAAWYDAHLAAPRKDEDG